MPYIITTTTPHSVIPAHEIRGSDVDRVGHAVTRRAVATLDEAQHLAFCAIDRASKMDREMNSDEQRGDRELRLAVRFDIAEGGTVGPLPDGTVVEVERVSWRDLYERAFGMRATRYHFAHNAGYPRMIDAYNAAQS